MTDVKSIRSFIYTLLILMCSSVIYGQTPSWTYTQTPVQHLFNFPEEVIVCSEDTLEIGDYLGLFYDSTGTLACAGYFIWNGGSQTVLAYGDDTLTSVKEGFTIDEEVIWKTFQYSTGYEYFLDAIYAHTPFYPDSGFFITNGASELVYLGNCVSPIVSITPINATCYGSSDGSAWAEIFPLNPPYTVTWAGGSTGDSLIGLSAGTYIVNIANSLGFVSTRSYIINDSDSIGISFTNSPVTDPGLPNGDIYTTITGGNPPYQYNWNNGATTQNLNNVFTGIYELTITDYMNCTNTDSTELPTIVPFPWTVIPTQDFHTVTLLSIANLFFNEDGLEIGDVIGVFYDSLGIENCAGLILYGGSFGTTGATIICYGDNLSTPEIEGFSIGEEFKWKVWDASTAIAHAVFPNYHITQEYPDSGYFVLGGNSALNVLSNIEHDMGISSIISPSTYCNLTTNESISVEIFSHGMANETMFNIKYNINGGPWLNETIIEPMSYQDTIQIVLSTLANMITPINYQIIAIIEANNDMIQENDTAYLEIFPIITSSQIVQDTMNNCVGEASVIVQGGSPPYTYLWNDPAGQDSSSAFGLCAGVYEVSVSDSTGCTVNQIANITNVLPPSFQNDIANVSCYGFQDGHIDITMSNFQFPINYYWSNGSYSEDLFNIGPGIYIITITDGTELSTIDTFVISQPDSLQINATLEHVLCFSNSTGEIDIEVSGGIQPYIYNWSTGESTEDLFSITADSYTVTITDLNDCSLSSTYNITQPDDLNTGYIINEVTSAGICDGDIYMSISGGTQPYSFIWNNGDTNEDLNLICGGYYSLTVTDQNNCEYYTNNIFVNQPLPILKGEIYMGSNLLSDGIAILFMEYSNKRFTALEYLVIDSGKYSFTIDPYNKFKVYALPNPKYNFNFYPVYFPTYLGDEIKWEQSDLIHTNININDADIFLESYDSLFYGYGSVSGEVTFINFEDYESNIYANNWFDTINIKSEDNIAAKNIPLILMQSDGLPVSYCLSGDDGKFSFENIKYGNYIIHAEKAGYKTQYKQISISSEEPDYTDMEVLIFSGNIYLNITSNLPENKHINIYPNPAEENIYIDFKTNMLPPFDISIFSSTGDIIINNIIYNKYINISGLPSGIYFINVKTGSHTFTSKFIKID